MSTRGAGIAGIACFVLIVAASLVEPLWDAPGTTAAPAEVARYTAENRDGTLVSIFVYALAMGLFIPFAAGVWARLRAHEPEPGPLAATFALAATAMVALIFAGFVPVCVLAYRTPTADMANPLRDLSFGLLAVSGVPTAVALAAYAVLVVRTRCLDVWSAAMAGAGAVAHVVIAASFLFDSGFFSLEGAVIVVIPATLFLWILLASVALIRLPKPVPPTPS